jgi:hypothetical protein
VTIPVSARFTCVDLAFPGVLSHFSSRNSHSACPSVMGETNPPGLGRVLPARPLSPRLLFLALSSVFTFPLSLSFSPVIFDFFSDCLRGLPFSALFSPLRLPTLPAAPWRGFSSLCSILSVLIKSTPDSHLLFSLNIISILLSGILGISVLPALHLLDTSFIHWFDKYFLSTSLSYFRQLASGGKQTYPAEFRHELCRSDSLHQPPHPLHHHLPVTYTTRPHHHFKGLLANCAKGERVTHCS